MEKNQFLYLKAKDSDYLHGIIRKKDWQSLLNLASSKNARKTLLLQYFQTEESKELLKELTEELILALIDNSSQQLANLILDRMCSLCDSDSKYTNIALKLMKDIYGHGGHLQLSSIVKCLPLNVLKVIIDSRIPFTEFHFTPSKQEFFSYILAALSGNTEKTFDYKNLKERDVVKGIFIYISAEKESFPLERREVFKEVIRSFRECFSYIENNNSIDWKSVLISKIMNPLYELILTGLRNSYYDYKNDTEIISLIQSVFDEYYYSKFFRRSAATPILNESGNNGILRESSLLVDCKIIPKNYYYKVFKKAVQQNKDNFIDQITRVFFIKCPVMIYIREIDDGIYKLLFNAAIDMSVRELIERKKSDNFAYCCRLLSQKRTDLYSFSPRYDECLTFIKSVISKIFEKKNTLNVDVTSYPEICCYILNILNDNEDGLKRETQNLNVSYLIKKVEEKVHTPLDFIDDEMRNKLVVGVIRHPVDDTKFSHIITSNNPTILVNYICYFKSVKDVKLIMPKAKRNTVDKYSFRESRSANNTKETCQMNLVEIFLHTLRFWENHDKSLFTDGYISYYHFLRKILTESILTNDKKLKEMAINVYYRFCELVSLVKNAKYIDIRIKIASLTFLTPLSVIVGSELDSSFVENFVKKFIQPFNPHSYMTILSEVISRSHIDMNYEKDEDDESKSEVDSIFKQIKIDEQFAIATKSLLSLIKSNPVKNSQIYYNAHNTDYFFITNKRFINFVKSRFETNNKFILSLCNPLLTEYPLDIEFNSPNTEVIELKYPEYKLSHLVFLELSRFVADEFKNYSPKLFKTNLTKNLISIQSFIEDLTTAKYDTFLFNFTLDPPTVDTSKEEYYKQVNYSINVLYSNSFFNFLNEINHNNNSIFNKDSYDVIKNAFIARFVNEEDFLKQQNLPPPKFDGFDISIKFSKHRNADNIFNIMEYKEKVEEFKRKTYKIAYNMNNDFHEFVEHVYKMSKLIGDNKIDDNFDLDLTIHRNHEKSEADFNALYRKNVHKCFTFIMNSLNKCDADDFMNEFDSIDKIANFRVIKKCASNSEQYSMLTKLFDSLINEFVSLKNNSLKLYKNRLATAEDIYNFMLIVSRVATPNIGPLTNLQKLTVVSEKVVTEKVTNRDPKLFQSIFKCGDIDQILTCMNSPLFSINSSDFYNDMLRKSGMNECKRIFGEIIDQVCLNDRPVLDDFHVALASCCIHPLFVGFPAPQSSLSYLKKITNRSISVKRSACANSVYYGIMNHTCGREVPLDDIIEIIESAHKKSPDEIIAFFCLLISEEASLRKMQQLPALNDLCNPNALPGHFIINQGPVLSLPKEIGKLYYSVIEKIILSGLNSKKSHIYELTVTVLNEINVGTEIHKIIAPFIIKGLNEIQPSDDNEAFIKYSTSFTMKSPEFDDCFNAYCEALSKIKKHSYAILKANNSHLNQDSPYPEPFKKLENSFSTIIDAIEKPFSEFKEEFEMVSVSAFCRKLLPVLKLNRPAVARDIFYRLESYCSIFGDTFIDEMVHLYKIEKKDDSLSKFIHIVTHHEELIIAVPQSLVSIYNALKSAFSEKHTIELSKSLADSNLKLGVSMQRAVDLANLLAPDVLSHIPETKDGNENEIVEILSNLGIFCKVDQIQPMLYDQIQIQNEPVKESIRLRLFKAKRSAQKEEEVEEFFSEPSAKIDSDGDDDFDDEVDFDEDVEFEQDVVEGGCNEDEVEDGDVDLGDGIGEADVGDGDGDVDENENELKEDQVKDAFDVFS